MNHSQWKTSRTRSLPGEQAPEAPEVAAARLEIRYVRAFGQALYDRRTELALSRLDVADRAGMAPAPDRGDRGRRHRTDPAATGAPGGSPGSRV